MAAMPYRRPDVYTLPICEPGAVPFCLASPGRCLIAIWGARHARQPTVTSRSMTPTSQPAFLLAVLSESCYKLSRYPLATATVGRVSQILRGR